MKITITTSTLMEPYTEKETLFCIRFQSFTFFYLYTICKYVKQINYLEFIN